MVRNWRDWEPSQDTKDYLNMLGWFVAMLIVGFMWLCPIWMILCGWI